MSLRIKSRIDKYHLLICFLLFFILDLKIFSQEIVQSSENGSVSESSSFQTNEHSGFEIFASFSQGTALKGYTDPRYIADDKTDYLKSSAMTANLEFTFNIPYKIKSSPTDAPLQQVFTGTDYLRAGIILNAWSIINGSSISIPKTGAPINADSVNASLNSTTRPGLGFFFGFGKANMELDFGLTLMPEYKNEGSRTRRVVDVNGNVTGATEEVPGRGPFVQEWFILPTFRWSYGERESLQFVFLAGRETYEFQRDYISAYFRIPVTGYFKLDAGIGLYPNATIFIQPNFLMKNIMLGIRGGMSLNYYETELKRVSINDTLYFGFSASATL